MFNLSLPLDSIEIYGIVKLADGEHAGLFRRDYPSRRSNLAEAEWCADVLRFLGERFDSEVQMRQRDAVADGGTITQHEAV